LEFVLGTGHVIPGFEKAVEGLSEGEQVSAKVEPEEAYGLRSDELVLQVPLDRFDRAVTPALGQRLEMSTAEGQRIPVTVTDVGQENVEVDANHPLAGQPLHFELELVKIAE
jgi:peptidylprolyl isomerase